MNKLYVNSGLLFLNNLVLVEGKFTASFTEDDEFVYFKTLVGEILTKNIKITALAKNEAGNEFYTDITELLSVIKPFLLIYGNTLDVQNSLTQEPSGFEKPEDCIVTYNPTNRTITLTGNTNCFSLGKKIEAVIPGWTSEPHDVEPNSYFLYFDGTSFVWSNTPWKFYYVQIALVYRDTANFCLRECHGLMQWQVHAELHKTTGTYLYSGGDISAVVLNSTTAAHRRPFISQTIIADEDLETTLPALNTNAYSRIHLTGLAVTNITQDNTDIIALSGNQPFYNKFNGVSWVQTLVSINNYAKIFIMALPTSSNADYLKDRYLFIQPQTINGTLKTIQNLTPESVNLGHIAPTVAEYVYIGEIIIQYTGGNWRIASVRKLTGSRVTQVSSPTGSFLSIINTDDTLTGDGTVANPLKTNLIVTPAPATPTSQGIKGQLSYDSTYMYLCVDTNTWLRTSLNTWS